MVTNEFLSCRIRHELVTRGDASALGAATAGSHAIGQLLDGFGVCLKINPVNSGYQADRIANGRGIHIVLQELGGNRNVTDTKGRRERACHARVDDQGGLIAQDHRLRTDGGVYLSNPAGGDDHFFALELSSRVGDATDGFTFCVPHAFD